MRPALVDAVSPWAAGLLLAIPVLVAFYPPMTDLPFHEAAIGILRHFDDPTMFPPGLYLHNLGEPNQLFYFVGWLLSYAFSTRWTVKIIVAAALIAIPVSAAALARYLGRSRLAALVVAPMALGWLFSWGLIANLVGLATFLFLLPILDRYAARPTVRSAAWALAAVLLLFLAHEAMMFVYGLMALLLAALAPWSPRRTAARLVPFLAVVAVHAATVRRQALFLTPAVRGMPVLWHNVVHKILHVPYMILPATDRPVQLGMLALCALVFGSFVWLRARERAGEGPREPVAAAPARRGQLETLRAALFPRRFELFALACLTAYLVMPLSISGATLVYQRFFPPAYAVFALALAPRDLWTRPARITRLALGVLPVATLFVVAPAFADSNRMYGGMQTLLPMVEPGSAIAAIDLGPGDPSRTYSLGTAGGRILATRGGRLSYSFTDSPISPVVIAKPYQWNGSLIRIGLDPWAFRPAHDLKHYRYLLVRAGYPEIAWAATYVLRPEADYVGEEGPWILFRSRLPVADLKSPEQKLEKPPPETIRELMEKLVQQLHEAPRIDVPPERPEDRGADHDLPRNL